MRHLKTGRKLNRNSSHRKAMFRNMAVSLLEHEMIKTTLPKAKELRRVAEPLITLAKVDSIANRRLAFARLRDKDAVQKLFTEIAPRFVERPGGYLSVLKCGFRRGDSAPMALVMLVGDEEQQQQEIDTTTDTEAQAVATDTQEVEKVEDSAQEANQEQEVVEETVKAEVTEEAVKEDAVEQATAEQTEAEQTETEKTEAVAKDDESTVESSEEKTKTEKNN